MEFDGTFSSVGCVKLDVPRDKQTQRVEIPYGISI